MSNLLNLLTYPEPFMVEMPIGEETQIKHLFELESYEGRYYFTFKVNVDNYQYNRNPNPEMDDYDTCDYEVKLIGVLNEDGNELDFTKYEKKIICNELYKLIES